MDDVALPRGVHRMAGGQGEHPLGGLRPALAGRRGDHPGVVRHHHERLGDLVDVERLVGLHHDRITLLEAGDVLEDAAVGVAVPGDGEVPDLAGQRGLRVVAGTLDVQDLLEVHALGEREAVAVEGGHVHRAEDHGVLGRRGDGRRSVLARGDPLLVHRAPFLLEPVEDPGLLAVGHHVGPPQLPHQEQAQQHPGGQQQLAEDPEHTRAPGPAAVRSCDPSSRVRAARAHRLTAASTARGPT